MSKLKKLEEKLTSHGAVGDSFTIESILLSNKYDQMKSNILPMSLFEFEKFEYANKYNLSVDEVKYNLEVVQYIKNMSNDLK